MTTFAIFGPPPQVCFDCGASTLRAASDADGAVFRCSRCLAAWRIELGRAHRVRNPRQPAERPSPNDHRRRSVRS